MQKDDFDQDLEKSRKSKRIFSKVNFIAFAKLDFFPQSNLLLDMENPVSTERNHVCKKWKYSPAKNNMIFSYQMLNQQFIICTRNPWRLRQIAHQSPAMSTDHNGRTVLRIDEDECKSIQRLSEARARGG